jgi:hypothetical protein
MASLFHERRRDEGAARFSVELCTVSGLCRIAAGFLSGGRLVDAVSARTIGNVVHPSVTHRRQPDRHFVRLSNRRWTRSQALCHSAFVMCVRRSQNPMQSRNLRPPPPAVLVADSLGLLLPGVGEGSLSMRALPPLKGVVVIGGDDNGAVPGNLGLGLPIAEGGGGAGTDGAGDALFEPGDFDCTTAPPVIVSSGTVTSRTRKLLRVLISYQPPQLVVRRAPTARMRQLRG